MLYHDVEDCYTIHHITLLPFVLELVVVRTHRGTVWLAYVHAYADSNRKIDICVCGGSAQYQEQEGFVV